MNKAHLLTLVALTLVLSGGCITPTALTSDPNESEAVAAKENQTGHRRFLRFLPIGDQYVTSANPPRLPDSTGPNNSVHRIGATGFAAGDNSTAAGLVAAESVVHQLPEPRAIIPTRIDFEQ